MMTANPTVKTVVSSQTPESIFERQARSGMWTTGGPGRGLCVYRTFDHDLPYAVDDGSRPHHEARRFATIPEALAAFPSLRAYCEREAAKPTWQDHFRAALVAAADLAGCDISALCWEHATLDNTWGDLVGLVFWGASDECNKRAASFFSTWAAKHGRAFGLFGGYSAQESVSERGVRYYRRYADRKNGDWYPSPRAEYTTEEPVEARVGWAASYVYYPGAD